MRVNGMIAADMFNVDAEDAKEYISSDVCFKLRSGKPHTQYIYYSDTEQDYWDRCEAASRENRRTRAHNGIAVPAKYQVKPKCNNINRDSIRKHPVDEETMTVEFARYSYAAVGMC